MVRVAATLLALLAGVFFGRMLHFTLRRHWKVNPGYPAPMIEVVVGAIWGLLVWRLTGLIELIESRFGISPSSLPYINLAETVGAMPLTAGLVVIAVLACHKSPLADLITLPGIAIGCVFSVFSTEHMEYLLATPPDPLRDIRDRILGSVIAGGAVLVIRWFVRSPGERRAPDWRDAHLMAMLAAWLGLPCAFLALGIGMLTFLLTGRRFFMKTDSLTRSSTPWRFEASLCAGGVVGCLWGPQILILCMHWSFLPKLALKLP
jgi:leader peptidase (prepilin peptidase) / N-methyltransferase